MEIEQGGRSAGTTGLRRPNDRRLFQLLRRLGEASKAELARRAQLTSTAVGTIIQALEQDGLVSPTGRRVEGQRGQPATLVSINPKGAFGIGVRAFIAVGGVHGFIELRVRFDQLRRHGQRIV